MDIAISDIAADRHRGDDKAQGRPSPRGTIIMADYDNRARGQLDSEYRSIKARGEAIKVRLETAMPAHFGKTDQGPSENR